MTFNARVALLATPALLACGMVSAQGLLPEARQRALQAAQQQTTQALAPAAAASAVEEAPRPLVVPASRETLRLTVWEERQVESFHAFARLMGSDWTYRELMPRPFAPGLVALPAVGGPGLRPVSRREAQDLGLTPAQAHALGLDQLRAALGPLADVARPQAAGSIGRLQGPAESSRVLLHADWAPLAQAQGGRLLVGLANHELLLWSADTSEAGQRALRDATREASQAAAEQAWGRRPTTALLRWTPEGWAVLR